VSTSGKALRQARRSLDYSRTAGSHGVEYARWHYERVSNRGPSAAVEIRQTTTTVQGVCALALLCVCNGGDLRV
jgi:hypothetical protein